MVYLAPKTPTSQFPMHLLQITSDHWLTRIPGFNRFSYYLYDIAAYSSVRKLFDVHCATREDHACETLTHFHWVSLYRCIAWIGLVCLQCPGGVDRVNERIA